MSALVEYVLSWVPWSDANARYHARVAFLKQESAYIRTILLQLCTQHATVSIVSMRFRQEIESMRYYQFGDKDSNLDSQIQSLASCRWTIPEEGLQNRASGMGRD